MVSQGLPWWASRREGMVRDAKGGPTVPQRNRLIVDNKLPLSSMPNNTMSTMRFVEYMFFFVKVNLIQFTTSSRRLDGGAYCGAPVGGKCMVSKAKLVLYAFAV